VQQGISGLLAEYIVAIDVARVRCPAAALDGRDTLATALPPGSTFWALRSRRDGYRFWPKRANWFKRARASALASISRVTGPRTRVAQARAEYPGRLQCCSCEASVPDSMTLAGLEPAIFGSKGQRLIH
jgi:hypothetical protein